jgi:hypothetical protein
VAVGDRGDLLGRSLCAAAASITAASIAQEMTARAAALGPPMNDAEARVLGLLADALDAVEARMTEIANQTRREAYGGDD